MQERPHPAERFITHIHTHKEMKESKKKVVLAFSGGLDTSFAAKYLSEDLGYEVHTAIANTGGFTPGDLERIEQRAYALGAASHASLDITEDYYNRSIRYMIAGNVLRFLIVGVDSVFFEIVYLIFACECHVAGGSDDLYLMHIGDTIIGIKGRVGFEAAAPVLIIAAHKMLEKHTLTKWQQYWKGQIGTWYGMFLHESQYLEPVMRDMEKFLESSQENVSGTVEITLRPLGYTLVGVDSPFDLMKTDFGEYGEVNKAWSADDVKGFTKILGNQMKIFHNVQCLRQCRSAPRTAVCRHCSTSVPIRD